MKMTITKTILIAFLLLSPFCAEVSAQFCFADALPFNFGNAPKCILSGDFNGDGNIDLLTYNEGPQTLTVAKGNGLGNFATPTAATTTSNVPAITAMISGDFNNDGKLDLIYRAGTGCNFLVGNNTGTFTLGQNSSPFPSLFSMGLAVGYFDSDTFLDLAVSHQSRILIAYGSTNGFIGATQEIIVPPGLSGSNDMSNGTLVAKDFNNDGLVDFAVNNRNDSSLTVLVNDGTNTYFATNYLFPANSSFDRPLKSGDFNGDGKIDLLSVSASNAGGNNTVIKVFLGDGLGGFANSVSTPTINQNYSDYQIADFDGDGILDICSNNQDAVKISKGTGTGSFGAPSVFYTSDYADAYFILNNFVVDDWNNDGRPDIATANFNNTTDGHKVSVLLNSLVKILTTVPATRCGSGTVTLSATADLGTIEWYDSPTDINNIGTGTSFTTPVLSATTTYYVGTSVSSCHSERIPVVATIVSNVNPTGLTAGSITSSAATFNWTVQNAPGSGFDYFYTTSSIPPTASTIPSGTTVATNISISTFSAATTYYFWVRSNCGASSSNWVGTTFTTLSNSLCNVPSGLSSGSITITNATLSWLAASPAPSNGYEYYYSTASTTPLASTGPTGTTNNLSTTVTGLIANTTYYYWVRSNCGSSRSNWVSGTSFTTLSVASSGCTTATFGLWPTSTFSPSCTGANQLIVDNAYAGEYSYVNITANKQYTFSSSVTTDYITIANSTGTVVLAHGPSPLVWPSGVNSGEFRYYLHTNASCGEQDTNRSRFIQCSELLANEVFSFDGLKLFPNPTSHMLIISNDQDIDSVALLNILGQLVKEQTIHAKAGIIDMSAFARGTYFVKVISAHGSKILKIIKE